MLEAISIHTDNKKAIKSRQWRFLKGKSCLTNLIDFYNKTTTWMNAGWAVGIFWLDFSKVFNTVLHNIFIGKLQKCRLDRWTAKWIENWMNSRSHSIITSGAGFSWSPVTSTAPVWFNVLVNDLDEDASSVSSLTTQTWQKGWCPRVLWALQKGLSRLETDREELSEIQWRQMQVLHLRKNALAQPASSFPFS